MLDMVPFAALRVTCRSRYTTPPPAPPRTRSTSPSPSRSPAAGVARIGASTRNVESRTRRARVREPSFRNKATPSLSEPTSRSRSPSPSRSASAGALRRPTRICSNSSLTRVETGPRAFAGVPVVVEPPGGLAHEQVLVPIAIEIAEGWHGVAAAGDGHECGVRGLEPGSGSAVPGQARPPLAEERVQPPVAVEVGERRRRVEPSAEIQRGPHPERRTARAADVLQAIDEGRLQIRRIQLVRQHQVEITVAVEIGDRGDRLAADIEHGKQAPAPHLPG